METDNATIKLMPGLVGATYLVVGAFLTHLIGVAHGGAAGQGFAFLWTTLLIILAAIIRLNKSLEILLAVLKVTENITKKLNASFDRPAEK